MDISTLRGLWTLLLLILFIGVFAWAYSRRRKHDFDAAANLPFADDLNDSHAAEMGESK